MVPEADPRLIARELIELCKLSEDGDDFSRDMWHLLVQLHQFKDVPIMLRSDDWYRPYEPLRHKPIDEGPGNHFPIITTHDFWLTMNTGQQDTIALTVFRASTNHFHWFYGEPLGGLGFRVCMALRRCLEFWLEDIGNQKKQWEQNLKPRIELIQMSASDGTLISYNYDEYSELFDEQRNEFEVESTTHRVERTEDQKRNDWLLEKFSPSTQEHPTHAELESMLDAEAPKRDWSQLAKGSIGGALKESWLRQKKCPWPKRLDGRGKGKRTTKTEKLKE